MLKRRLKEPFGKAGLTVAVCALVMALVGGAYAAGGLTKAQEKQVTKIAKKYAGKPGPAGANGTNGASGTPGARGETGAVGPQGPQGNPGSPGSPGTPGSPWTAGGTLPKSKSLTGEWSASGYVKNAPNIESGVVYTSVSFALPLPAEPTAHYIHVGEGEGEGNEALALQEGKCAGTYKNPGAAEGQLCVFASAETNSATSFFGFPAPAICSSGKESFCELTSTSPTVSPFGFTIFAAASGADTEVLDRGTWAVTAE